MPRNTDRTNREERIAFIQACWHRDIVDEGRDAFLEAIQQLGYRRDQIELFEVPGTLEIPLFAKRLAKSGRFDAIVADTENDEVGRFGDMLEVRVAFKAEEFLMPWVDRIDITGIFAARQILQRLLAERILALGCADDSDRLWPKKRVESMRHGDAYRLVRARRRHARCRRR